MAPNRFMTDLDYTKTQIAVYFVVILLSVDALNPIHVLCQSFPGLEPWHMAALASILLLYIVLSEFKQVLYFGVQVFFHSILSIFFQSVEVVGLENIPRFGPVIFTINHANQFIDATAVLCTCQHKISYLMAEASWKRRIIGDLAWALDVVPVKRAQDDAVTGTGTILALQITNDNTNLQKIQVQTTPSTVPDKPTDDSEITVQLVGLGTHFTKDFAPGDKIRINNPSISTTAQSPSALIFKVTQVCNDTTLTVVPDPTNPKEFALNNANGCTFDILKKVDTHVVFEKVLDRLASGGAVGIFPEGGSHDRTELLPLKVGIALIAYSALDKDNLLIPIVPVGLNYFRAHRWRGRAVIEYGRPTMIDPATLPQFQAGGSARRQVCQALLEDIERSMKSVLVSAPDYDTLQLVHTARRLWQRKKGTLDVAEKQDLTRRFAQGYQFLLQHPNPPKKWIEMKQRIIEYRNTLKETGIRDYQVPALIEEHYEQELSIGNTLENPNQVLNILHLTYQTLHLLFLISVAAIPFLLINFPVGMLAGLYAERRRQSALAKSKVKVKGYDVMLTEKVVFCIVAVPTLWVFYAFLLYALTDWSGTTIILCMSCLPLFAYMGIVAAEAGMVDWNDLRPLVMRLSPGARKKLAALPRLRKELQDDLRAFIKDVGPKYLGDLYFKEKVDWTTLWEKEKYMTPRNSNVSDSSGSLDRMAQDSNPSTLTTNIESVALEEKGTNQNETKTDPKKEQ